MKYAIELIFLPKYRGSGYFTKQMVRFDSLILTHPLSTPSTRFSMKKEPAVAK